MHTIIQQNKDGIKYFILIYLNSTARFTVVNMSECLCDCATYLGGGGEPTQTLLMHFSRTLAAVVLICLADLVFELDERSTHT